MSETGEYPLPRGSRQILMLSTVVMAVLAVAVLALGIQDPRLLRLGLVAALWAALLGAFATARLRRESSLWAEHVDQLTVERELREQAQQSQRQEIVELRAEFTALRANLEQLLGSKPQLAAVPTSTALSSGQGRHGVHRAGNGSTPRRSHEDRPAPVGEGVFRHSVGGVAW